MNKNESILKQTKNFTFLPYEYNSTGLSTYLSEVRLDENIVEQIGEEEKRVYLSNESNWSAGELRGSITFQKELIKELIPDTEYDKPPLSLILAIRSFDSFTREYILVDDGLSNINIKEEEGDYSTTFHIDFKRSKYRGKIKVTPYLIRTSNSEYNGSRYATSEGERLASGRKWTVVLDREKGPPGKYLDIRFDDFTDNENLPDKKQSLYFLDYDRSDPTLWLNRNHENISNVLQSRATRGSTARIRDVLYDSIVQSGKIQLFMYALSQVREDYTTTHEWQEAILQRTVEELYPELDFESSIDQLLDKRQDLEEVIHILRKVDLDLQVKEAITEKAGKLINEMEAE